MMQLKKTSPGKALKALYVVPLVLIGIASNANTVYDLQDVRVVSVTDTLRIHGTGIQDKNMKVRTVVINGKETDTAILKSMPAESISSVTINKEDGDAKVYIVTVTDTLSNRSNETQKQDKQHQKIIVYGEYDLEEFQSVLGGSLSSLEFGEGELDFEKFQSMFDGSLSSLEFGDGKLDLEKLRPMLGESLSSLEFSGSELDFEKFQSMLDGSLSSLKFGEGELDFEKFQSMLDGSLSSLEFGDGELDLEKLRPMLGESLSSLDFSGGELDFEKFQSMSAGSISSVTINKKEGDGKVQVVTVVGTKSGDGNKEELESKVQVINMTDLSSGVSEDIAIYVNGEKVDASEFNSLDTENIKSVEVDKQGEIPVIKVTLKNKADKK